MKASDPTFISYKESVDTIKRKPNASINEKKTIYTRYFNKKQTEFRSQFKL